MEKNKKEALTLKNLKKINQIKENSQIKENFLENVMITNIKKSQIIFFSQLIEEGFYMEKKRIREREKNRNREEKGKKQFFFRNERNKRKEKK